MKKKQNNDFLDFSACVAIIKRYSFTFVLKLHNPFCKKEMYNFAANWKDDIPIK